MNCMTYLLTHVAKTATFKALAFYAASVLCILLMAEVQTHAAESKARDSQSLFVWGEVLNGLQALESEAIEFEIEEAAAGAALLTSDDAQALDILAQEMNLPVEPFRSGDALLILVVDVWEIRNVLEKNGITSVVSSIVQGISILDAKRLEAAYQLLEQSHVATVAAEDVVTTGDVLKQIRNYSCHDNGTSDSCCTAFLCGVFSDHDSCGRVLRRCDDLVFHP